MEKNISLPIEIISRPDHLDAAVREIAGSPVISMDTESNSMHHYPEQLCLVQIATPCKSYIIDPVLIPDIAPLESILSDDSIQKVIHGADYDLRSLDRHHGFHLRNIYDTTVAARFAGISEFGLASLTRDVLGITIIKSKRLQRADWGLRPLSGEAIEYAATDVLHLIALREVLSRRLGALGRTAWVEEECSRLEKARYTTPDPDSAYLSIKGAKQLSGRGLAILKDLFLFRDKEALNQHRPPHFIMPNATLIYLAANPTVELSEVPGLGQTGLKRFGQDLQQAIIKGMASSPVCRTISRTNEHPGKQTLNRLKQLKDWRTSLGSLLSLDPSLLWPAVSLERLSRSPDTLSSELQSEEIRCWQRDQFASSLAALLKTLV